VPNARKGNPTLTPPVASTSTDLDVSGTSSPTKVSDEQIAALVAASTPLTGPTMAPPATAARAAEAITGTWRNNVSIDALWTIDEPRNAWVHVVGLGWRKIYNGRDGAFQALTTLASQARQTNRPVNLREEAGGMIYEVYLW
jgi:hypothetical protein